MNYNNLENRIEERVYFVTMTEDEFRLFSEFLEEQREFSKGDYKNLGILGKNLLRSSRKDIANAAKVLRKEGFKKDAEKLIKSYKTKSQKKVISKAAKIDKISRSTAKVVVPTSIVLGATSGVISSKLRDKGLSQTNKYLRKKLNENDRNKLE